MLHDKIDSTGIKGAVGDDCPTRMHILTVWHARTRGHSPPSLTHSHTQYRLHTHSLAHACTHACRGTRTRARTRARRYMCTQTEAQSNTTRMHTLWHSTGTHAHTQHEHLSTTDAETVTETHTRARARTSACAHEAATCESRAHACVYMCMRECAAHASDSLTRSPSSRSSDERRPGGHVGLTEPRDTRPCCGIRDRVAGYATVPRDTRPCRGIPEAWWRSRAKQACRRFSRSISPYSTEPAGLLVDSLAFVSCAKSDKERNPDLNGGMPRTVARCYSDGPARRHP